MRQTAPASRQQTERPQTPARGKREGNLWLPDQRKRRLTSQGLSLPLPREAQTHPDRARRKRERSAGEESDVMALPRRIARRVYVAQPTLLLPFAMRLPFRSLHAAHSVQCSKKITISTYSTRLRSEVVSAEVPASLLSTHASSSYFLCGISEVFLRCS
jgi:hypothetical protein